MNIKKPCENKELTKAIQKMRLESGYPVVLKASESKALLKELLRYRKCNI